MLLVLLLFPPRAGRLVRLGLLGCDGKVLSRRFGCSCCCSRWISAKLFGLAVVAAAEEEPEERRVRLLAGAEEAARSRRCWRKRSPMDCLDMMALEFVVFDLCVTFVDLIGSRRPVMIDVLQEAC